MRRLLAAAALMLAACSSPEATRTLGGGPGPGAGNRAHVVRMHEGSRPYHDTPRLATGEPPPLDAASQAREFGR